MALTSQERRNSHRKQDKVFIQQGVPTVAEMTEGIPSIRITPDGVAEYVKVNGALYKKTLEKADVSTLSSVSEIDVLTFSNVDSTPSVSGGNFFHSGTSTETIDAFGDGAVGQVITVISKAAITYDFDASNLKCGTGNLVTASGDVTRWIYDGTYWYLLSWTDINAALHSGSSAGGF